MDETRPSSVTVVIAHTQQHRTETMMSTPRKPVARRAKRADGEGSVYLDRAKGWTAELPPRLGRSRKSGFGSKSEANTYLRRWITEIEGGADVKEGRASIRQLAELWLRVDVESRDCSPGTKYRFRHHAGIIVEHLGGARARGLDAARVEAMYAELVKTKGWSRQSLVSLRSTLGQMYAFAVTRRMITVNDDLIRYTKIPSNAAKPERKSSLTLEQARALWDGVEPHRLGAMWRVGLLTGLRPGELAGLLWSSVDLDSAAPSVTISRSVQLVKGTPELRDGVKTDGSYRTIALAPQLVPVLRAHQHAQNVERLAAKHWHDQGLVFTTGAGAIVNPSNVRRELAKMCDELGVPAISSNELRHTAASLMLDQGMSMDQVARVLGHKNTRMLEKHYAHRVRPVIDDHVAAMSRAFEGVGS